MVCVHSTNSAGKFKKNSLNMSIILEPEHGSALQIQTATLMCKFPLN